MGEVGEADPGQSEVLEVDEGHGVAVQEGDVGGVDVEDVVRRLLDVQAFQVRAGVDLESMLQNLFFSVILPVRNKRSRESLLRGEDQYY